MLAKWQRPGRETDNIWNHYMAFQLNTLIYRAIEKPATPTDGMHIITVKSKYITLKNGRLKKVKFSSNLIFYNLKILFSELIVFIAWIRHMLLTLSTSVSFAFLNLAHSI